MSRDLPNNPPIRLTLQVRVVLGQFARRPATALANNEIAQALDLGPGTVSEILARFVREKIVDEVTDGRRVRFRLTSDGLDLARAHGLALVPTVLPQPMQNEPGF